MFMFSYKQAINENLDENGKNIIENLIHIPLFSDKYLTDNMLITMIIMRIIIIIWFLFVIKLLHKYIELLYSFLMP
jgi:hypothetical protein